MDREAARTYATATASMDTMLQAFRTWAKTMLTDNEQAEILFHIAEIAKAYARLCEAVTDFVKE